jgi:putative oxidoreductase
MTTPAYGAAHARTHDPIAARFPGITAFGPITHALLRIGAGLLFMEHGAQKLFGMFGGFGGTPGASAPLASQMGLAGVLEFFGGLLIVLGLFTRPVAFLLAGQMVWAFFQAHFPQGGVPMQNGGELPLLYSLVFLYLFGNGPGPYSVDSRIGATRR